MHEGLRQTWMDMMNSLCFQLTRKRTNILALGSNAICYLSDGMHDFTASICHDLPSDGPWGTQGIDVAPVCQCACATHTIV